MTTRRAVVLIVITISIVALGAVIMSCARDGGLIRVRNGDGNPAAPLTFPGGNTPATAEADEDAADSAVDYDSFESGDLLFNAVTVKRHALDLTTFMKSVAAELENDNRIEIVDMSLDGDLRPDGSPVSVIRFFLLDPRSSIALVGRQYAVVTPDGEGFSVLTCITNAEYADQCDDEMRTIDFTAIQ